jgi:predicted nucleic acid-binding Zn ribbon protein
MPTYVYKFIDSGETIEVQQAFSDEPLTEIAHPVDGVVKPVKKVFTPVGVSFKGGGFYKTDSGSSSKSSSSATTPAAPAAPAAPSTPSAD